MKWTEGELRLALALYCQLPFGKMHSRNPEINRLAARIGRTPSAVAMKLVNLASLDPDIVKSGRTGLGNASALDRSVWERFRLNWDGEFSTATEELGEFVKVNLAIHDEEPPLLEEPSLPKETSSRAEVEIRKKQYIFRRMVMSSYVGICCMSGLSDARLLVASHIIPWSKCEENRLNPKNGLCLSALHDKAFDIGLITVKADYSIAVSPEIKGLQKDKFIQETLVACHGNIITLPEKFHPAPEFLKWHNENVFLS